MRHSAPQHTQNRPKGGEVGVANPPTQAELQALRDSCEELADDVRALSALVAVGVVRGGV